MATSKITLNSILDKIEAAKDSSELSAIISQLENAFEKGMIDLTDNDWPKITMAIEKKSSTLSATQSTPLSRLEKLNIEPGISGTEFTIIVEEIRQCQTRPELESVKDHLCTRLLNDEALNSILGHLSIQDKEIEISNDRKIDPNFTWDMDKRLRYVFAHVAAEIESAFIESCGDLDPPEHYTALDFFKLAQPFALHIFKKTYPSAGFTDLWLLGEQRYQCEEFEKGK